MPAPYGYRIEHGKAVIDEPAAEQIRALFRNYLSGMSMKSAAKTAGIMAYHGTVKRLLQNRYYLGDEFYPAIIDEASFSAAEQERVKRAVKLGCSNKAMNDHTAVTAGTTDSSTAVAHKQFTLKAIETKYADPVKQAEYMYSLIVPVTT